MSLIQPGENIRLVAIAWINAAVIVHLIIAINRFFLAPHYPQFRFLPVADKSARYIDSWMRWLGITVTYGYFALQAALLIGMPLPLYETLLRLLGLLVTGLLILLILQNRQSVAQHIRGMEAIEARDWNFTLAASSSGYPGYTQEDTKDLYSVMQLALEDVKTRCHAQIGKIGMLGFSDGALYAAYISKMDSERRQIGIATFLLVNPPVDLFEAARKIDRMAAIGKDYGTEQKNYLEAYAFGVAAQGLNNDISAPDYFTDWNKRLRLKDEQIEFLIGKNLNDAVGDAIYVIDLAKGLDILKAPINWAYRSGRLEEARSYGLIRYVETILIPRFMRIGNKEMKLKTLDTHNSVRGIKSTLANNQRVFLMHNLDDVLISQEDIAYLEKLFGDRAVIYPHGGHLGNLWYPENKKHILDVFKPLLQESAKSNP